MSECTLCKQKQETIDLLCQLLSNDLILDNGECRYCKGLDCSIDNCNFQLDKEKAKQALKDLEK